MELMFQKTLKLLKCLKMKKNSICMLLCIGPSHNVVESILSVAFNGYERILLQIPLNFCSFCLQLSMVQSIYTQTVSRFQNPWVTVVRRHSCSVSMIGRSCFNGHTQREHQNQDARSCFSYCTTDTAIRSEGSGLQTSHTFFCYDFYFVVKVSYWFSPLSKILV